MQPHPALRGVADLIAYPLHAKCWRRDDVVRGWGERFGQVKRETGQAPSVIDTLLAATAIRHDLFLVTRNVRDVKFSGAAIFNPWEDDSAGFPLV